jgi:hypothetical protein
MRPHLPCRNHSTGSECPASSQLGCRLDGRWQSNPVPGCFEDCERATGQIRSCLTHSAQLVPFSPEHSRWFVAEAVQRLAARSIKASARSRSRSVTSGSLHCLARRRHRATCSRINGISATEVGICSLTVQDSRILYRQIEAVFRSEVKSHKGRLIRHLPSVYSISA